MEKTEEVTKKEQVVAPEQAEVDFERFLEAMGIDLNPVGLNDDEKSTAVEHRSKIISGIVRGAVVVTPEGQIVFTPERSENKNPITFYEPTGSALIQMDRKQTGQDVGKMYNLMAAITKEPASRFSVLKMNDVRMCMAVASLFLA